MPRPFQCRRISCHPGCSYFKPQGIPLFMLEEVVLTLDEYEAVRLADMEGLYQEDAAAKMDISRPTFGRIIETAHKKIAEALVKGKALKIEGGVVTMAEKRKFQCADCGNAWEIPFGTPRPSTCPACGSSNLHRSPEDRGGPGRGAGPGQGACRRGGGRHGQRHGNW